jgi:hypothetical protein
MTPPLVGPGLAGAIQIYTSAALVDPTKWIQVRFPRSKKRRIRKKWFWRSANWSHPPLDRFILIGGVAYCHPEFARQVAAEHPGSFVFL